MKLLNIYQTYAKRKQLVGIPPIENTLLTASNACKEHERLNIFRIFCTRSFCS